MSQTNTHAKDSLCQFPEVYSTRRKNNGGIFIWLHIYLRNKILTWKKPDLSVLSWWCQEESHRLMVVSSVLPNARLGRPHSLTIVHSPQRPVNSIALLSQTRDSGFFLYPFFPQHVAPLSLRIRGKFHFPFSFLFCSFLDPPVSEIDFFSPTQIQLNIQKESRLKWINTHSQTTTEKIQSSWW